MELITIKIDGTEDRITVDDVPTLDQMQSAVGGYIETVPYFERFEGKPCVAFCDEEGKLKQKPINEKATMKWAQHFDGPIDDVLVGDIFIITGTPEELAQI